MEPLSILAGLTIGLHMATVHIPHRDYQNNYNPGVYVSHNETGLTVGTYHNTLRRTSVYVSKSFDTGTLLGQQTSIQLGGVTGYKRVEWDEKRYDTNHRPYMYTMMEGCSKYNIAPLIAFSSTLPEVQGITPRITLVPPVQHTGSLAIHFSMEHKF
jgi:hypothetical protein